MKRTRALDVLRGIAILMILIHHYSPDYVMPGRFVRLTETFWSGVDLFFVLSGFLIATILLENANATNYFKVFYIRRSARILPLYWLLLFVVGLLIYAQPTFFDAKLVNHLPLWSYMVFIQNFLYPKRGYWNDPWLDVTWSLALEEQFYIFLSVVIKWTNKNILAILSIVLIILAPILGQYAISWRYVYQLPIYRAASLMMGVLMAILWQSQRVRIFIHKYTLLFWLAAIPFILNFRYFVTISIGNPMGHLSFAFLYTLSLILALGAPLEKSGFIFGNKILEWFGLRSYGLYLLHKPVYVLSSGLLAAWSIQLGTFRFLILTIVILFILAELSYRFFEKRFMELGHRFKYNNPTMTVQPG